MAQSNEMLFRLMNTVERMLKGKGHIAEGHFGQGCLEYPRRVPIGPGVFMWAFPGEVELRLSRGGPLP